MMKRKNTLLLSAMLWLAIFLFDALAGWVSGCREVAVFTMDPSAEAAQICYVSSAPHLSALPDVPEWR